MKRALLAAAALCLSSPLPETQAAEHPNILCIISDDVGHADFGFTGSKSNLTPNLDRFASEGTRLTQFYATPVCAATRAALLTGRLPFRQWMDWRSEDFGKPDYLELLGMKLAHLPDGTPTRRLMGLDTNEHTLPEALKENGYTTALFGKWHLGEWLPEHLPMGQGFDHQYGFYGWGIDYNNYCIPHNAPAVFAVYDWHRNQQPLQEQGYVTDLIANEAVRLLATHDKKRPFYYQVAFNAIHGPLEEIPRHTPAMDKRSAALKCLDEAIGRVLSALDQNGLAENTLVIFFNDNGGLTEEVNRPWRGTKNTTFEGGIRVPCVFRWPGKIKAGVTSDAFISVMDLLPTLVTLTGGKLPQNKPLDGIAMNEVLLQQAPSPRTELLIEATGSVRLPSLRKGKFKLVGEELFDLSKDPAEKDNIAEKHPDVVNRMKDRIRQLSSERPPLGDLAVLMDPALPDIYGQAENQAAPEWVKAHVNEVRSKQPQTWAPGTTPWPQAPKGGKIQYTGDGR